MATQKVSVTLQGRSIEEARRLVGPRGLSSYVDAALEEKLDRDGRRRALLDHLDELEHDDPTPHEVRRRAARRAAELRSSADG